MLETDRVFAGSIPELYDRLMVPLLFQPYASDLAGRAAAIGPRRILETAAGTGALTRALISSTDARIIATDLNQPMLDRAAETLPTDGRVEFRQADAMALPFEDHQFDLVACQFGVMFFPDRVRGFSEARRVLRPGGTFLFNSWDQISENIFVSLVSDALAKVFPGDPPTFMERTPHGYHDTATMRAELEAAGFASAEIETVAHDARAASPHAAAMAYCQGSPLRNEIEARGPGRLDEVTRIAADALARVFGDGPIEGKVQALVVAARR